MSTLKRDWCREFTSLLAGVDEIAVPSVSFTDNEGCIWWLTDRLLSLLGKDPFQADCGRGLIGKAENRKAAVLTRSRSGSRLAPMDPGSQQQGLACLSSALAVYQSWQQKGNLPIPKFT